MRKWKTVFYKAYPRLDQVLLPKPTNRKFDLYEALMGRESCRDFFENQIDIVKFSDLLYYSVGMKKVLKNDSSERRMHPSAGGRYPLETYVFVFNVDEVDEGVYHYHLKTHSLECVLRESTYQQTMQQFQQSWIKKSGLLIVITSVFDRSEMKYKDRAYRHILTEYGHVAQNLYLVGNTLGLGVCSIGGFSDDGLNEILDIDGMTESVIGVVAVGIKSK